MPPTLEFSHLGLCVSNLDRAVRFYGEGLGFSINERSEIGEGTSRLQAQFIRHDSLRIELLCFSVSPRRMSASEVGNAQVGLGFTHLTLRVADVDAVVARVREFGGTVDESSRFKSAENDRVLCTDPDGTKIQLLWLPDSVSLQ